MYASTSTAHPADAVARVMVWPVATVGTATSLLEVAEALAAEGVGVVAVVHNDRLAGLVSERDVVQHLAQGANPEHVTAADVMSVDLVTVGPDDHVLDTARRMVEADVRHLPVMDGDEIAGIVSMRDLFGVIVAAAAPWE
ncbi:cyclic nucleotide-binding/CBS domain-containing protein [Nocardioides sp. zg-1228]|uniref:CBS domain-containing protein n=1 Tax=Nocardioides sp. zg-1228 TaxID=2763008 RepID=UPI001642D725|nr:CBS domain-containing protein [Nocardioides sp. zg-1228]MBC2931952.1 CBS domain-containing protein [Nocardioides sp. zg-1228]QSF57508.1 CBS domain-containing protein [Nocardioides sp. zg-1228]